MTAALLASSLCGTSLPVRRPSRGAFLSRRQLVCQAQQNENLRQGVLPKVLTLPAAAALAGILMTSAVTPDEALAARSSGRMGGSSFKSAPRSAPRAAPSRGGGGSGGAVRGGNTYNTYVAPPVYGGYGGGYGYGGGGGLSFFPRFYAPPIFGFGLPIGGFFNFLFTMFVVTTIFGVIRGAFNKSDGNSRRDDDDRWD